MPSASRSNTGYIPTLDGWRAIAIFSVIAFHDNLYRLGPFSDAWMHQQGARGVDLFFAISGLLICGRLLDEERRNGNISLRNFYIRRTLRIMPAMLAYLAVVAVLGLRHVIHVGRLAWLSSVFFLNNYYSAIKHDWSWSLYTNHFWSLAVEEHFYLFLPSLLVFFPRTRARILAILSGSFLAWSLLNAVLTRHNTDSNFNFNRTDLRIYALLFPALLAVLLQKESFRKLCIRYGSPWLILPAVALVSSAASHASMILTRNIVIPFTFPLLILSTMLHPQTLLGRILEWAPLRALGRISYSIYLWQQLFFVGAEPHANGFLGSLQHGPWNYIATLALAAISYKCLEKPLMRLGHRLATPATPGHADLAAATQSTLSAKTA